jgi:hypothetical protein
MPSLPTVPDSDSYNWIIVPVTRCIQAVADGAKLSGLLQRAVSNLAHQEVILGQLEAFLRLAGKDVPAVGGDAVPAAGWVQWAKELMDSGLHEVHAPGVIALWASLEVMVEDTATLILVNDAQALGDVVATGVKASPNWPRPLDESNARRAFSRFEQVSRGTRSIGQAYAHMMQVLGVHVNVRPGILETIAELNYVRNCILHRGGIVDPRVSQEAPRIGLSVGETVRIGREDYLRYFGAVGAFAQQVLEGAIASRHARWKQPGT